MDIESAKQRLSCELQSRQGVPRYSAKFVFAPYRICPLGAHIDHQLGPVTAMAIDHGILLAYAPSADREVRLRSLDYPGEVRFGLDSPGEPLAGDWGDYARGAVRALTKCGHKLNHGLVGVISGPWSEGGLGSSAAVGVAYLMAIEEVNGLNVTAVSNVMLDQDIETDYLGLRNGILDQSGSLLSRKNHLTLIDCSTASHEMIPAPDSTSSWSILIAFSGLNKALVGTNYNRRVAECAAAARILLDAAGRSEETPLLGRVRDIEYAKYKEKLPAELARRAEHFFSEVERVRSGVEAWKKGDLHGFGELMTASGASSISNYECGCQPLIDLYEVMVQGDGVYGARFSGAGFRGCCVALVGGAKAADMVDSMHRAYAERQPELAAKAFVVVCESDDGARWLSEDNTPSAA